jgi:alpha-L-fucosidase 2
MKNPEMFEKIKRNWKSRVFPTMVEIIIAALITFLLFLLISCQPKDREKEKDLFLWYKQPAKDWNGALPIGNGRVGAMIFGGINSDTIQFNEESLWAGKKMNYNNPGALENLDEIRELLFKDRNQEALMFAREHLLSIPPRFRSYQVFGNLIINSQHDSSSIHTYERKLTLNNGLNETIYKLGNTLYKRQVFSSVKDDVIIVKLLAEGNEKLNFNFFLQRDRDARVKEIGENALAMEGQIVDEPGHEVGEGGEHMKFAAILQPIKYNGTLNTRDNKLYIMDATEVVLALAASTNYDIHLLNFTDSINPLEVCQNQLADISGMNFDQLFARHEAKHRQVFERVHFTLGNEEYDSIPTDVRLKRVQDGAIDNDLMALYFQYGRYLLMGSSMFKAQLPANLQGIWNDHYKAPWNSDFHTNINLQMNYWPAEVCNLQESIYPYVNFFNETMIPGAITAKEMYGSGGWVMHHATDAFGYTGVNAAIKYGMFPMGGAWVTFPVWRHYEYTLDTTYLEEKAWPLIKGATEFVLDFLVESPDGYLVTSPSYSPENTFLLPSGEEMQLTYAPTMDIMIIKELFKNALDGIKVLGSDTLLTKRIESALDRLPPIQVGKDGTIQEWIKDYEEAAPWHRHVSHLLGLHPGTHITKDTPVLFEAARKTLERRLEHGGAGTGWSRAWTINFYARLKDGENAYKHLTKLLQVSTLPNLFDTHPPFQIDGNFGGTAGIAEMILQSHEGMIEIFPALPDEWPSGEISGIKARDGFVLDITWENKKLENLVIHSVKGRPCKLKYQSKITSFITSPDENYILDDELNHVN